jgi:ribonuclease T
MKQVPISVDTETDGPIPGVYSLCSIGATRIDGDAEFYVELRPITDRYEQEYYDINGLDRESLQKDGIRAPEAMDRFAAWLDRQCGSDEHPLYVAKNATFDWMFTHWYFHRFIGRDPFGHWGFDLKAWYTGLNGLPTPVKIAPQFRSELPHTHNALDDAREQADMFRNIRSHFC